MSSAVPSSLLYDNKTKELSSETLWSPLEEPKFRVVGVTKPGDSLGTSFK